MTGNEQDPVKDKLCFLLSGNLGPCIIKALILILAISIHGLKKILGCCPLHVKIGSLHSIELDSHGPLSVGPHKHFLLLKKLGLLVRL